MITILMLNDLLINSLMFIVSTILLYKGSDILIIGTSKTAARIGVSSLIISLTIVAYGTSAPELTTSTIAAIHSHPLLSLGNVIGSCFANLLLVLGISAIVKPISVSKTIIRREVPILLLVVALFTSLSYFGLLNVIGGTILIISFVLYILFFLRIAHMERDINNIEKDGDLKRNVAFIIFGIIGVVVGAELLVDSAVFFARWFGVSEMVIAVSMVAIGTSIPELVVSSMASNREEGDISIGNLIGSNIFNILLIMGIVSIITEVAVDFRALMSMVLLFFVTLFLVPIFYTGKRISRIEGVFLVAIYCVYIWFVFFV
ncbi:MAG TPA: calcium/sodium antiporter [Thermoplasmatales archaeon]|nr:calcium/sodium antiporter [Thermoplasmatales archaeon]